MHACVRVSVCMCGGMSVCVSGCECGCVRVSGCGRTMLMCSISVKIVARRQSRKTEEREREAAEEDAASEKKSARYRSFRLGLFSHSRSLDVNMEIASAYRDLVCLADIVFLSAPMF